ncbi:ATP-binding protein [Cohnella sp. GCM10027633]|uniref:ATP-binding protein n=1 Tax=unclassified Cohnella TaxID=2636738 RepID=UPI00363E6955
MNLSRFQAVILLVLAATILLANPRTGYADTDIDANPPDAIVKQWEIQWMDQLSDTDHAPSDTAQWLPANTEKPLTTMPQEYDGAWVHIVIPPTDHWLNPGLLVSHMYGINIEVYEKERLLYRSTRDFTYDRNMLLVALTPNPEPTNLYVRIESVDRAGLGSPIRIGNYNELSEWYIHQEMPSLLLGAAVAFLAIIMLLISGYLNRGQRGAWVSLSLIALTSSIMILTYSTLPFVYFKEFGNELQFLFDMSMLVLFPALHFYVASIFEGKLAFFKKFGQWFAFYSAFCVLVLITNQIVGEPFFFYYKLFTFWILAPFILVHLVLVLSLSVIQSIRGNKNSIILASGFLALTIMGIADLMRLYANDTASMLFYWKIGIVMLIFSLVIVLARRISADYRQLLAYSKELELFNHRLQRTEKLKFISDLAASIAHEVRNPLQVTRGFLQLISGKSDEATKPHFNMAISELDRASTIITDFLTFAKPELDTIIKLDIQQEMTQIETIITPLAAYHGAALQIRIPDKLYVLGNSSKFKQAFMNMIKNSIEALKRSGVVEVEAYAEQDVAVIRIVDTGEGMEPDQIAKLGEPYFSTKTKGTGLGLMVTFRIIEVMQGTIEFRSEKGKGTEAIIRFPLVQSNQPQV